MVARPRLVRELMRPPCAPLVLLVAPAGYGKTALLAEWAAQDRRPFAWLDLGAEHNDPSRLLEHVAYALDPAGGDALEIASGAPPLVLVLDDAQVLRDPAALAAVSALRDVLSPGSQLALASRSEPSLPLGRLRAQGHVRELRARDLAMTAAEARTLLAAQEATLDERQASSVARRAEGWAAGLRLAAHSPSSEPRGERFVTDFIRDEFLSALTGEQLELVMRSSVLDRLSGPLCDAVLETRGSATALAELARSNLLLLPLDGGDHWYRLHTMLEEVLRSELRRLDPELEPRLHIRASAWFEDHGDAARAIDHAVEAHDVARAADLLWRYAPSYAHGRDLARLPRWLARFTEAELAGNPRLALVAAQGHLAAGDGRLAEHSAAVADSGVARRASARRDSSLEAGLAAMRAGLARDGLGRMAADAALADALEPDGRRHAAALLAEGVALHLNGERDWARGRLQEGARAAAVAAPETHALCLAQLALLAIDEEDRESAGWFAARAKAVAVGSADRAASPPLALVFAVSAAVRAGRGQLAEASDDRRRALDLLGRLHDYAGWHECETRIALARACLRLRDSGGAGELLAEAARLAHGIGDAPALGEWLAEARSQAPAPGAAAADDGWALTQAELRVLQFLPSHLSFPEIAARLFVSPNTVKTHVRAVYRKLDVCSRAQAVERADRDGLVSLRSA